MIKRIQLYKFNYSSVTNRPTYRVGQKSEVANSWSRYSVIFLLFSFCGGLQNVFTGRFIGKFAVTGDQKFLHSLHIKHEKSAQDTTSVLVTLLNIRRLKTYVHTLTNKRLKKLVIINPAIP